MATAPSIKGSVFGGLVEDVNKLLARSELSRDDLSRWLEPGDIALLEQDVHVAGWYDIRSYDRINALLLEVMGGGDTEFFREQGRRTARRLMDSGLYAQMEYLNRIESVGKSDPYERFETFGRDLRLLSSLSGSILNFTRWRSRPDPDVEYRYLIEVSEAHEMPESLCWRSDGFMNGMSAIRGNGDLWSWERPRRDLVVFRMLRAV
jgi:hypothetical protein